MTHPANGLDDVVHQRVRLGILTVAHEARRVEFGFLRTTLDLTAGNLGQHLTVLENAGLVQIEKGYEGRRARTWVSLTAVGDKALRDEIAYLKRLIRQVEKTVTLTRPAEATPRDVESRNQTGIGGVSREWVPGTGSAWGQHPCWSSHWRAVAPGHLRRAHRALLRARRRVQRQQPVANRLRPVRRRLRKHSRISVCRW